MSAATKKTIGTVLSAVLAALAVQFHNVPLVPIVLPSIATFLLGWLHLPQPSDAPKL